MHPQLLDLLAAHPDCYFQLFTNGQFITEKVARRLRELGNATPLVSIEGREITSDERRGKSPPLLFLHAGATMRAAVGDQR